MCMTPFAKTDQKEGVNYRFPCGKCPECSARRIAAWSFRLIQQEKISLSAHFLTLTYDTLHVPISDHGFMSLKKRDVQLFIKRLRKSSPKEEQKQNPIRYYCAGEYGGRTKRPHYHIIIFNARVELLQPAWDLGQIHYGTVGGASIGYTLKYISKPKTYRHANDDRTTEFALMSKRLGANYLTPNMVNWHHADLKKRMYMVLPDGKKVSMPRYYKDKIYDEHQRAIIAQYHVQKIGEKILEWETNPNYETNEYNKQQAAIAAFKSQALKSAQNDKL